MNNDELERLATQIEALVPEFELVCKEHGQTCDPKLTSDDLKALVASWRKRGKALDELKLKSMKEELRENNYE